MPCIMARMGQRDRYVVLAVHQERRQFPVVVHLATIEFPQLRVDTVANASFLQVVQISFLAQSHIPMVRLLVGPLRFPSCLSR